MEDSTGGLAEHFQLQTKECPRNLYSLLRKSYERKAMLGCSIEPANENEIEFQMSNGTRSRSLRKLCEFYCCKLFFLQAWSKLTLTPSRK